MNIKSVLLKTFNLKPEEGLKFSLLFFHSFCLGLFIALYFAPANSIFIQNFGSEQLPIAYIVSGIAGYIISLIYSALQKRVSSKVLFLSALIFMFCLPLIARFGLNFVDEKWLSFFVFIWAWPFISLVTTESGGLVLRFLNLMQVKRLFGLINMGGVIASILGYLTIPILLKFIGSPFNLLYISVGGVAVSIFLIFVIYKKFDNKKDTLNKKDSGRKRGESVKIRSLAKEKYFFYIFLSATFSMTVIYFSDFGFLASIKAQQRLVSETGSVSNYLYLGNFKVEVSNFIAFVFGGLKIGELLISIFSSRLLSKYGVKLGLTILPIATAVLIIGATLSSWLVGVASLVFFAFMILNKSFERILRRGLDDPSFNILYQPLPEEQKLPVQTSVGAIMQLAIAIAGTLLLIVTKVLENENGFDLRYFTLFFLPILLLWTIVARKLYLSYKEKLRQVLEEKNKKSSKNISRDLYGADMLRQNLYSENIELQHKCLTILSETHPRELENYANKLLQSKDQYIVLNVLRCIDPTWESNIKDQIIEIYNTTQNEEIKNLANKVRSYFDYSDIVSLNSKQIKDLSESTLEEEQLKLIKYLSKNTIPEEISIISILLNSKSKIIKKAAIYLAGKKHSDILVPKLIEFLETLEFRHISGDILQKLGDDVIPELELLFDDDVTHSILLKVIEIYAHIGTPLALSSLLKHINYPNKEIQVAIIKALYYNRYQASEEELPFVKQKLKDVVENILWIFVCINDIESQKNTLKLVQALDVERENNFELLFDLLSFIYQPATIDLIKTNIKGENTIFALEIIENFISQEIKQPIIPLLDKISVSQRMKKLRQYFPMQRLLFTDRLKEILITSYSRLDLWTRAKAIELLGRIHRRKKSNETNSEKTVEYKEVDIWTKEKAVNVLNSIRKSEIPDEIFLCLFHPDELVYSTAAKIIYDENPSTCTSYLKKFNNGKQELINVLQNESADLLNERVKYIRRVPVFFIIPENILVKLAKLFKSKTIKKKESIDLKYEDGRERIIIILKGKLIYQKDEEGAKEEIFSRNDIVLRNHSLSSEADKLIAKSNTLVLIASKYEYFNLLIEEKEILNYIFAKKQSKKTAN